MKLHLGCGNRYIPGYVHIDVVEYPHIDHVSSIDNLSFISDNSVELIYSCHVLEHFKRKDVNKVLTEWYRVIKPNGIIRISVPDFNSLCRVYSQYQDLSLVIGPLFGRQNYLYNIHYNVFDFKSLSDYLIDAGFKNPKIYNPFEVEHSDIDDYSKAYIPHMDFENGICISLNIEATK